MKLIDLANYCKQNYCETCEHNKECYKFRKFIEKFKRPDIFIRYMEKENFYEKEF